MTEKDLIKTLCSLQLTELMYRRLPKDAVHSKQSPVNRKYCGSAGVTTGKEMTTALSKSFTAALTLVLTTVINGVAR